ncbi:MAG: damage-inducible mutagenesis protein [Pseudomonadota bacterium]|nr:damage-inducible mutagenesis protein [Pseudomonadota bacterium]
MLPFGIDEIDGHLPGGGLMRGALHEVFAADAGIATAFCALLAGRLTKNMKNASVLWCERPWMLDAGSLYGPALSQFGIDPTRLILVRPRRDSDVLWAMEEGLRCGRVAAVIGELDSISLTASRRLQLAAEESGTTAISLRSKADSPAPSAAVTRWRLGAITHEKGRQQTNDNDNFLHTTLASPSLDTTRWRAELFRCRGGASANWMMEWNDETGDLSMATEIRNRPPVQAAARLAG